MLPGFAYRPKGSLDEDFLYGRQRVTDSWPRGQSLPSSAIAVICDGAQIVGVGLLETGQPMTSFERRIAVSDIEISASPIQLESVVQRLPRRVAARAGESLALGGPIPPQTWVALRALLTEHPEFRYQLERLESRITPPSWTVRPDGHAREIVELEQDATGLALSMSGIDRHELDAWRPPADPSPFLAGLDRVEVREDQLLHHDMQVFGTWKRTGADGLSCEFSDRNGRSVTVMNLNRADLESTLGVDLIYYNASVGAFTLLQYKRMRREPSRNGPGSQPVYRSASDKNLPGQLALLRKAQGLVSTARPSSPLDCRLGDRFCFIKVCKPEIELGSTDLVRGLYFDLDLCDVLQLGQKGAKTSVTYDTEFRHLTNTQFIDLVRNGWVGSRGEVTNRISTYIRARLAGDTSVTLAIARD